MERPQARRKVKAEWDKLRALRKEWDARNDSTRCVVCGVTKMRATEESYDRSIRWQDDGNGARKRLPRDGAPICPFQVPCPHLSSDPPPTSARARILPASLRKGKASVRMHA